MRYQITAAYYPVWPVTEAQRGILFSYTGKAATDSILQATLSIYTSGSISAKSSAAAETLRNIVTNSRELLRKFFSACHQAFNTGKQFACNYYFKLLGYSFILRGKAVQ